VSFGSVNPATRQVLKTFPEHADEQRWSATATADQAPSHNAKEAFHWFEGDEPRRNMNSRLRKAWQWVKGLWHGPGPSWPYYIRATPNSQKIQFESIADLSEALTRAKDALSKFERRIGRPEANWPRWCAAHMAEEQGLLGRTRCGVVKVTGQVEPPPADPEEDYWSRHE
jgi:hypothetical protein